MIPTIIISALIIGYTIFVIIKKSRDVKAGKSCCSDCSGCQMKDKCDSTKKT